MKKIIYGMLLFVAVLVVSCSKEVRINRKLDGEWKVTSISGQSFENGQSMYFTFQKDGKSGKGSLSYVYGSQTQTTNFDYALSGDKLTLTPTSGTDLTPEVLTINTYESKKIEMTDSSNDKYVLEPK